VFVGLYLLGIVVAIISARLLRRFKFKTDETPFVMELPPYRMPTMKATLRNMWAKTSQYLRKMGGIILVASIIVWALSYFPRQDINSLPESVVEKTLKELPAGTSQADAQQVALTEYQQQNSILGHIGNGVEPVVKPLGFDKNEAIALVAGAAAKEIVVSTLGVIYTGSDSNDVTLSQRLAEPTPTNPNPPFTPLKAITFMVFVLLYFPCLATLTAIYRETGTWRYPVFSMLYNTAVAYLCAFIVYRVGLLLI
jgi:ferrous iron transport protein B